MGGPSAVGDANVEEAGGIVEGILATVLGSVWLSRSSLVSVVETLRSDGKTALMTGLVRSPTRPSCTTWDAVLGV